MAENTAIEWAHHTFNVAWGCTKVSPACANCYAEAWAKRHGVGWGPQAERRTFGDAHWREPLKWDRKAARLGERHRVFCSSMCDVFEDHPTIDAERAKLWPLIEATPNLDWLLLTKRPENALKAWPSVGFPDAGVPGTLGRRLCLPNVWLGVTAENQEWADKRIPVLLSVPATVRFLSCEPLLGPVDLSKWLTPRTEGQEFFAALDAVCGHIIGQPVGPTEYTPDLHWVIVGGESGPGSRNFDAGACRAIVRQCRAAGVAVFVKQMGRSPWDTPAGSHRAFPLKLADPKGGDIDEFPADLRVREFPALVALEARQGDARPEGGPEAGRGPATRQRRL